MPQINATLPKNLIENLQNIANKTDKSFSKIVCEILELGIKLYEKQDEMQGKKQLVKEQELEAKHTEYLLRILAINADILRCVLNEKSKYNGKNVEEILNTISANAKAFIGNYINNG